VSNYPVINLSKLNFTLYVSIRPGVVGGILQRDDLPQNNIGILKIKTVVFHYIKNSKSYFEIPIIYT
jgi:hypothetical protein